MSCFYDEEKNTCHTCCSCVVNTETVVVRGNRRDGGNGHGRYRRHRFNGPDRTYGCRRSYGSDRTYRAGNIRESIYSYSVKVKQWLKSRCFEFVLRHSITKLKIYNTALDKLA
mgnify:CR=1 FL=1